MFKMHKYPYALFMGHLALEKLLKAVVVKNTRKHAPYTHSLEALARKAKQDRYSGTDAYQIERIYGVSFRGALSRGSKGFLS